MRTTTAVAGAAFTLTVAALTASPAQADPKGQTFEVVCENGKNYVVAVNGNGEFTPGHDTASTTVLVPTSFSGFTFVVTNENDEVLFIEEDPSTSSKGSSGKERATTTDCSFSVSETFVDPDLGTLTQTFSGDLTGFVTPVRR